MACTSEKSSGARGFAFWVAMASILSVAACGKKPDEQAAKKPAGQVIAQVGGEDVTIQELENEFRLANIPFDKRDDALTKRMLGEIVARKYLVQQAVAAKLDREPAIHLDIMRSREQVLASGQMQRALSSKASSIGNAEVDKYIAAHPVQFAKREILTTDQIMMPITSKAQEIVEATKDFKTLDQVEQTLKANGMPYNRSTGALDGANLTEEFLATIRVKKTDDIFFTRSGPNGVFFKVTGEQAQALVGDDAANRARQALRMELLKTESDEVTQAAQSSSKFEGDYARIMDVKPPENAAPAPTK